MRACERMLVNVSFGCAFPVVYTYLQEKSLMNCEKVKHEQKFVFLVCNKCYKRVLCVFVEMETDANAKAKMSFLFGKQTLAGAFFFIWKIQSM